MSKLLSLEPVSSFVKPGHVSLPYRLKPFLPQHILTAVRVHLLSVLLLQVSHREHVRATRSQRRVANWRRERRFCNLKPKCSRCGVSEEVCPVPHYLRDWRTRAVGRGGLWASTSWTREARQSAGSQGGWESLKEKALTSLCPWNGMLEA